MKNITVAVPNATKRIYAVLLLRKTWSLEQKEAFKRGSPPSAGTSVLLGKYSSTDDFLWRFASGPRCSDTLKMPLKQILRECPSPLPPKKKGKKIEKLDVYRLKYPKGVDSAELCVDRKRTQPLQNAGRVLNINIIIYPLTARIVGVPQMISQPVSLLSPVLHCPLGPGEFKTQPVPDVVFPPLPLSALSFSPSTVPCKMVLAKPDEREACPYHCSLRLFTMVRRSSCAQHYLVNVPMVEQKYTGRDYTTCWYWKTVESPNEAIF